MLPPYSFGIEGAFEAGGGYQRGSLCDRVLDGVGFRREDYKKDVAVLSGGELGAESAQLLLGSILKTAYRRSGDRVQRLIRLGQTIEHRAGELAIENQEVDDRRRLDAARLGR